MQDTNFETNLQLFTRNEVSWLAILRLQSSSARPCFWLEQPDQTKSSRNDRAILNRVKMWTQQNVWEQQMSADQHFELSCFEISSRENCYWQLVDFGEMSHSGSSIGNTTQGCSCLRLFFNVSGPSGLIQQFRGDSCQSVGLKGAWKDCNCFKTRTETKTMHWYGLSVCDAEQTPKEHCSTKSLFNDSSYDSDRSEDWT